MHPKTGKGDFGGVTQKGVLEVAPKGVLEVPPKGGLGKGAPSQTRSKGGFEKKSVTIATNSLILDFAY